MSGGFAALLLTCLILGGCTRREQHGRNPAVAQAAPARTDPVSLPADDGQWIMPAKDYANTRFSALDEVRTDNVKNLRLAWTFSTGTSRGHEASPLVAGGTMYYVTPFPNILHALDATTGEKKWSWVPAVLQSAKGVACCDQVNRGAAWWNGRIYYATLDNQVIAVDAASGREVWKTRVGDINLGESMTMAPLVVKGKVLVGNAGGEFGVRGWIKALDANTGQVLWTGYHTGPDKEVLIGPGFKPFYAEDRGRDLGVNTWPPDHWKIGGGMTGNRPSRPCARRRRFTAGPAANRASSTPRISICWRWP